VRLSFAQAFADSQGASCASMVHDRVQSANQVSSGFQHSHLQHFHEQLNRFNRIETADVELVFCRLVHVLEMDPDLSKLPVSVSKTDPSGGTVSLDITAPTETFATTLGYEAKAVLKRNGTQFMTMYWAGSGDSSKGFLIQGANPMHSDGMKRLRYIQWDRSGTQQIVKVLATQFENSFLGSLSGSPGSESGGDNVHFGRLTYDTSTKAISGQSVEIRAWSHSSLGCKKSEFNGTLGGSINIYREAHGTPVAVTDANTDGTGMDGIVGVSDSANTGSGTGTPATDFSTVSFDYSCNDLDGMGTSGAFASNSVNYAADPTVIFPH